METVALEEAWGRYKDKDVVFIGISVDDRPRDAEAFLQQFPVTYPNCAPSSPSITHIPGIDELPMDFDKCLR